MDNFIYFKKYLTKIGHTPSTIKSYMFAVTVFLEDNPEPEYLNYKQIVYYLSTKSRTDFKNTTKIYLLNGIKKYYDFLIETAIRVDHPCRNLFIRNLRRKSVVFQDLFSFQELQLLFDRKERYSDLKQRNQLIISLLIYQGLTSSEIRNINLSHVDFEKGRIYIKGSKKIAQRHLSLVNVQLTLFHDYLKVDRRKLIRQSTSAFILGKLGNRITVDDIHYLVYTFKPLFPDKNISPSLIRQSVITYWLNDYKYPLEQVQLMAGQKWISSTARYRDSPIEAQRKIMNQFHPFSITS
jgi:site-specific recombinase XerD